MVVGSFGAVGINSEVDVENDCGCRNNNYMDTSKSSGHAMGIIGELRDYPDKSIAFMGNPPTTFSWKDFGGRDFTTVAKSQGQCGSCWAFADIGVVESVLDIQDLNPNLNMDLSEQYPVSCGSILYGMNGCGGAVYTPPPGVGNFIDWTKDNDVVSESCFPYTSGGGVVPPCNDDCPKVTDVVGWGWVSSTNRVNIENALIAQGPLVASMEVYEDFHDDYTGGIYAHTYGDFLGNHVVSIVGYNENQDYWICKNSWGADWGENGFFRIAFGNSGIDSHISFIEADYGDPTATKYANQCFDHTSRWEEYGTHGMKCDNYWTGGPDYIYYNFNVPKNSPGPIIVGIEFNSDLNGANGGPNLEVLNPSTGSYDTIRASMGDPGALKWKWFVVLNDYVSSSNELKFRVLCAWGCYTYIDDVGVKYTASPPPPPSEPDLECYGQLSKINVESGSTVTGSFTVENVGESGSKLDWKVDSYPNWGSSWSFIPSSGNDLEPNDESVTVDVSFVAPSGNYEVFEGKIKVINKETPSDYDEIPIVITTPISKIYPNTIFSNSFQKTPFLWRSFSMMFCQKLNE